MLRTVVAVCAIILVFTSLGLAKDDRFDVSFNGAGVFTTTTTGNGVTHSATDGANFFGTFRWRFIKKNPHHSLIFNYGRAKDSQIYESTEDFHVLSSISEYTGAYVYSFHETHGFEPFVFAGAGALRFSPRSTWVFFPDLPDGTHNRVQVNVGTSTQTEVAYLYGVGVDHRLPHFKRFSVRLQYRGLFYRAPDFNVTPARTGSGLNFFTGGHAHMAEPSIGLVFRF